MKLFLCSMQKGYNAFLLCATAGHLAVAEYLAPKMEGHLFASDDAGYTALHWAAQEGQLSMVEYLVRSCGFDVKAIDKVGLHCLLLFYGSCIRRHYRLYYTTSIAPIENGSSYLMY